MRLKFDDDYRPTAAAVFEEIHRAREIGSGISKDLRRLAEAARLFGMESLHTKLLDAADKHGPLDAHLEKAMGDVVELIPKAHPGQPHLDFAVAEHTLVPSDPKAHSLLQQTAMCDSATLRPDVVELLNGSIPLPTRL